MEKQFSPAMSFSFLENIYIFEVNSKITKKGVKYVQS